MKIRMILLLALFTNMLWAQSSLDIEHIDNLCHDETYQEWITLSDGADPNSLTMAEKIMFKNKKLVKAHHEYFNAAAFATHDVHLKSYENMFPKWYTPASTVRSDETGVRSFFANANKYLTDGWVGGVRQNRHESMGRYEIDLLTGAKYLHNEHSEVGMRYYRGWHETVSSQGFLPRYTFSYPTAAQLSEVYSLGYEVERIANLIKVRSDSFLYVWDTEAKIFVEQELDGTTVLETKKTYYSYNEELQMDLIHLEKTITPKVFSNGDCYDLHQSKIYSNYSTDCIQEEVVFNNSESDEVLEQPEQFNQKLNIYPNPTTDQVSIQIPNSADNSVLKVLNLAGSIMLERKVSSKQMNINLKDWPKGIYLISVQQGNEVYNAKLVKQ